MLVVLAGAAARDRTIHEAFHDAFDGHAECASGCPSEAPESDPPDGEHADCGLCLLTSAGCVLLDAPATAVEMPPIVPAGVLPPPAAEPLSRRYAPVWERGPPIVS